MGTDSIQMNPLRFASNLSRSTRNNIVRSAPVCLQSKRELKNLQNLGMITQWLITLRYTQIY